MSLAQVITPFKDDMTGVNQERSYTLGYRSVRDGFHVKANVSPAHFEMGRRDAQAAIAVGRNIGWSARDSSAWVGVVKGDSVAWGTKGQLQKAS